MSQQTVNWH